MKAKARARSRHVLLPFAVFALGCGFTVAGVMMFIALDHNPMGEYCSNGELPNRAENCTIQWRPLSVVGLFWFFTTVVPLVACYGLFVVGLQLWRRAKR